MYWEIGYVIPEASARFSICLRRETASSGFQRYNNPSDRKVEYQSLPRGSAKSKNAKVEALQQVGRPILRAI